MRHAGLGWLCVLMAACGAASRSSPPAAKVAPPTTIEGKRALFTRAHGAVVSGHYAETIPMLETLCPVYTELQDYCLHDLAVSRAHAGDGATADVVWAQLVSTQPQSLYTARANLERGRWRRSQGDLAGARPLLESARASEDDEVAVQASLKLAELERAAGEPDAAAPRRPASAEPAAAAAGTRPGERAAGVVEGARFCRRARCRRSPARNGACGGASRDIALARRQ